MNTRILVLPDRRRLAYSEYGDRKGHPTLYFHGFPGSRLEAELASASAARAGVRLIAADRPGIGGSDVQPDRRLLDWPADVVQLADHLGLARFTIVGVSAGGPYVAACAHSIAERLDAAAIVSGVAPFDEDSLLDGMLWPNKVTLRIVQRAPRLLNEGLRLAVIVKWFPRFAIRLLASGLNAPDRDVLARTEVREAISRSLAESLRRGARGHADELRILASPWGFRLEDVSAHVHLWHGGRDRIVPPIHCQRMSEALGQSHCELLPVEGHFSLVIDHASHIFARLAAARTAAT